MENFGGAVCHSYNALSTYPATGMVPENLFVGHFW